MPLRKSITDPFSLDNIPNSYVRCYSFAIDFKKKTGVFYFDIFRSEEAWAAGKEPIGSFQFNLTPDGTPAEYAEAPLITPGVPEVFPIYGPNGETLVEAAPAIPAVFGEAELIKPAFPSFDQAVVANKPAYDMLAASINALAKIYDPTLFDIV